MLLLSSLFIPSLVYVIYESNLKSLTYYALQNFHFFMMMSFSGYTSTCMLANKENFLFAFFMMLLYVTISIIQSVQHISPSNHFSTILSTLYIFLFCVCFFRFTRSLIRIKSTRSNVNNKFFDWELGIYEAVYLFVNINFLIFFGVNIAIKMVALFFFFPHSYYC